MLKVEATESAELLQTILDFLTTIPAHEDNGLSLARHYEPIKARYGAVLKKLAE